MRKILKILLIILSIILLMVILLFVYVSGLTGYVACLFKNCKTHSCITNEECFDVWCPHMGPILGGGDWSGHCSFSEDCKEKLLNELKKEFDVSNITNYSVRRQIFEKRLFEECQNKKECECIYY